MFQDHPHYPITVATCEDRNRSLRIRPLTPNDGEAASLFRVQDPFGLRKAIVPMFHADEREILTGMGTGFALDPWGRFLTADHVIDFVRTAEIDRDGNYVSTAANHLLGLLGFGLVFGTVTTPPAATIHLTSYFTPAIERENPLDFSGRPARIPYDIAIVGSMASPGAEYIRTLPLRARPPSPRVGDLVVAIGFPQIELARGELPELPTALTEGMFAAYGVVTDHFPTGRDSANPTPVFEVSANWPSGMSGGPVLNAQGEVVGLVSRSMAPDDGDEVGVAWASWLAASVAPSMLPPSLEDGDPFHRQAWCAYRSEPWALEGFPSTEDEAKILTKDLGSEFVTRKASWRLGTDTYTIFG